MESKNIQVQIITIGDEILIGQVVDTNSAWMAAELNKAGFEINKIISIHDKKEDIQNSLDLSLTEANIVLITGGIGPTNDDITKQTLCDYFHTKLVFSDEVHQNIEHLLRNRPNAINPLTKAQAMVPENCTVIQNKMGTAPITWFEKDDKVIVSMPGVPYEMKAAMESEIIPRLQKQFNTSAIIHKTVLVYGYPESLLALKIADWENNLKENVHLAYLPNQGLMRLRLSGSEDDILALEFYMNQQIDKLKEILGDAVISEVDINPEELIGKLLKEKGKTISTAESCTGGNIAHQITKVAGSSEYFKGSVVAYSNEAKINILKVSKETIEEFGAVSQEVVEQMAINARKIVGTDIAVSTSGIAGPTGGTEEKPVGTVWIAVSTKDTIISKKYNFPYNREQNIERATQTALLMIKEVL